MVILKCNIANVTPMTSIFHVLSSLLRTRFVRRTSITINAFLSLNHQLSTDVFAVQSIETNFYHIWISCNIKTEI